MNEELKIVVRAATTDAKKNLGDVKDELAAIEKLTDESGTGFKEAMAAATKGTTAALAAITALTAAMIGLNKSTEEFRKAQAKVNTTFQAMGSSAQQASKTFKGVFSFLGETDRAAEAAQSLGLITTNAEDLATWVAILEGAYASMGDKLPVEGLAEAANETIKTGVVVGQLADALNWLGISEDAMNATLAQTNSLEEREVILRNTLNGLYGGAAKIYEQTNAATIAYNNSQYNLNTAMAAAAQYTVPFMTALNNLGSTIFNYFGPAIRTAAVYLTAFVEWVATAISYVASFFGLFDSGSSSITSVGNSIYQVGVNTGSLVEDVYGLGGALSNAANEATRLKKQTMGFDELNVVSKPVSGGGGGNGGLNIPTGGGVSGGNISTPSIGAISMPNLDLSGFKAEVDEAQEKISGLMTLVGIAAIGFGAWKIIDFIYEIKWLKNSLETVSDVVGKIGLEGFFDMFGKQAEDVSEAAQKKLDGITGKLKTIGGTVLIVAGSFLLIKEYTDAWANGVDWGNMALGITGAAIAVGGLYLALGPLAASIGVVAAGVAFMVLGMVDFIKNGPSIQNTVLIIGGAIAVAVGLATAGLSVLVSAIIAAVAAVAAFTAAIILEEPAIMSVEDAQQALTDAKNRAIEAENGYINAVDAAEAAMKRLEEAEAAAGITGEELYKQVQSGTLDYANMTDAQKEVYKAYLDNEQKQKDLKASTEEFNAAKKAETLASYEHQLALAKESGNYEEFKKSVIDAYESGELSAEEARDMIAKSMSEMSDASQKTFMEDLPGDLKNGLDPHKYESTGTKIKKWFKNLWEDIKGFFKDAGEWFANVGKIAGEAISNAFKTVINWILDKVEKAINLPFKAINEGIDILNAVPGISIKKLSLIEVPKLATGGILTGESLFVGGEGGKKEAVLPLEQNTEWMDILAERINGGNTAPTKVALVVDGKELGWATINGINGITRQTGSLQLAMI